MNAGDTIIIPLPDTSYDSHLWIVISDPSRGDECMIVNFTSSPDKDQACVVVPGEHPYVTKRTCVNFKDAKKCKTGDLDRLDRIPKPEKLRPLSAELLAKIRIGRSGVKDELGLRAVAHRPEADRGRISR